MIRANGTVEKLNVLEQICPSSADFLGAIHRLLAANAEIQNGVELESGRIDSTLKAERYLFRAMIDQVPDYLFVKDIDGRFIIANRAVAADLGRTPDQLIGKTDFDLHRHELASKFFDDEQQLMNSGQTFVGIKEFIVDASGNKKWFSSTKAPLRDHSGQIVGLVGVCRDITDRKLAEEQMQFMALHDALTELPNRNLLLDRMNQSILQIDREGGQLATIFIDLDNFKNVNDSQGHKAGDELLKTVAKRMSAVVRASDTVARLGGDEFVVLLIDHRKSIGTIRHILERLRKAVAKPVILDGQPFKVTSSIGVAVYPGDGGTADALLLSSDIAMYEAKQAGRDNYLFYTKKMDKAVQERRILQESLRSAISNQEFTLVYQPQMDLKTGRVFAVEALVRWNHPVLGTVMPGKFIPLAEESGLIVPLGDWVLREACKQNKNWHDSGLTPVSVCVNVSARQFQDRDWVARVAQILDETGLEPCYLELELTESMLMHDVDHAIATMQDLQSLGVNFAIDDFGTGYSSLSSLKDFPAARLKIDRSFIRDLPHDADECSIAKAVISLGRKLNMRIIAEGVETEDQLEFLRKNKCDEIQGFHISRPVDPSEIPDILTK